MRLWIWILGLLGSVLLSFPTQATYYDNHGQPMKAIPFGAKEVKPNGLLVRLADGKELRVHWDDSCDTWRADSDSVEIRFRPLNDLVDWRWKPCLKDGLVREAFVVGDFSQPGEKPKSPSVKIVIPHMMGSMDSGGDENADDNNGIGFKFGLGKK